MIDPDTRIGAVTLKVADLDKVSAFYEGTIGLQVLAREPETVSLGAGDRTLVVLRHLAGGRFVRRAPGLYHLAIRVPSRQELGRWLRHYVDLEAPFWQGASDHGVSEALYLSDPEGNGIEVYRDRPKEQWPRRQDGQLEMYNAHLDLQALMDEAPAQAWSGLPPGTDMGHVHLKVAEIEAARRFYVDLINFNLITEWGGSALFVAAGDYHHHLGLNTWDSRGAPPVPADAYGLDAFELVFSGVSERQTVLDKVVAGSVPLEKVNGATRIQDPFGNWLSLTVA